MSITFENLSYLTTHEMWELMRDLRIPYCNIEEVEKEDLTTHEKVTVPKFVPRTDFDNMKSDILVAVSFMNREQRRKITKKYEKLIDKRIKQSKVIDNG